MAMVYVINDMNHNFSRASKYGTIVYATEGKVPIFKIDLVHNLLKQGLNGFKETDYLLVSGPPILCMIATLIITTRNPGMEVIKTLIFDAKKQEYVIRHLPVFGL